MAALDLLVRQGKALYVGVSNFSGVQFEEAVQVAARMGLTPITIHQPRYNLLDRRAEYTLFEHTQRAGVGVIVYSPLEQGMLTSKYLDGIPEGSRAAEGRFLTIDMITPERIAHVRRLNEIAGERGQTLAQMAVAWTVRDERVTSALIGASSVAQLEENVAAIDDIEFTPEEIDAIDRDAVDAGINIWQQSSDA